MYILIECIWADFTLSLQITFPYEKLFCDIRMTETIAVRIPTLRVFVLHHLPGVTVAVCCLRCLASFNRVVSQSRTTEKSLALCADMWCKLTFVGHSFLALPLSLVNTLPDRVIAKLQVE